MTRYLSWNGRRSSIMLGMVMLVISGIVPLYSPSTVYACYTWSVGSRVGLRAGAEIREGSGFGYQVHTIVPENNWQVDVVGGPRSVDGEQWWDISRRNVDGGGTGWVYIRQAGHDVCSGSPQPPQPQPQPPTPPAPPAPAPAPDQVQLCEHADYGGSCETFTGSDADLRDNTIRNDQASSIRIPAGYTVALYEHVDYQGRCESFTTDVPTLVGRFIGNDSASSIQLGQCSAGTYATTALWVRTEIPTVREHQNYGVFILPTGHSDLNLYYQSDDTHGWFLGNSPCRGDFPGVVGPGYINDPDGMNSAYVPEGFIGTHICGDTSTLHFIWLQHHDVTDPSRWRLYYYR